MNEDNRREDEGQAAEAAEPPRHPVLEQIFGAPIETVPEGQPLRPLRRPLPVPLLDTPAHEPLAPRRRQRAAEASQSLLPGRR
jgi:hypothetical protein